MPRTLLTFLLFCLARSYCAACVYFTLSTIQNRADTRNAVKIVLMIRIVSRLCTSYPRKVAHIHLRSVAPTSAYTNTISTPSATLHSAFVLSTSKSRCRFNSRVRVVFSVLSSISLLWVRDVISASETSRSISKTG